MNQLFAKGILTFSLFFSSVGSAIVMPGCLAIFPESGSAQLYVEALSKYQTYFKNQNFNSGSTLQDIPMAETAEEELAFAATLIEFIGHRRELLVSNPEKVAEVIKGSSLKPGDLSERTNFQKVFNAFLVNGGFKRVGLSRFTAPLLTTKESEARLRVESALIKERIYPQVIAKLQKRGLSQRLWGVFETGKKLQCRSWLRYISNIAVSAMMIKSSIWFVSYPVFTQPSNLFKVKEKILDTIEEKDWDSAQPEIMAELKLLGISDQIWRFGRKVYILALASAAMYGITVYSPYAWTFYTAQFTDPVSMAKYETETYDSQAVIKDEYQKWINSLDYHPTTEEQAKRLREITQMEADGLLRIYSNQKKPGA